MEVEKLIVSRTHIQDFFNYNTKIQNGKTIKMASVSELNKIASSGYQNFDMLEVGKPYKVLAFEIYKSEVFNKVRDCVRVNIENGFLILPERFDAAAHKMKKMKTDRLYIIYNGREGKGNRIKIQFEEMYEGCC